jgi:diguanylate cyclase (GGDEF)-like protein/PAS domain S-box-containing protein
VLAEALAAGVIEEDLSALMAMGNIARDRPGFHKTLDVRAKVDDEIHLLEFEILHDPSGPIVRLSDAVVPSDGDRADPDRSRSNGSAAAERDGEDEGEPDVVSILTDTLVETSDLVAIFRSVGHEALWANDAFVTVVPIREADKIWFVELLDEWSKGHYEVKVLPALVKFGRWSGQLTLITGEDEPMPVSAFMVAHRDKRGEIEAISLVARDMSQIRTTEEPGLGIDSRFAALVENASDIIAVLDERGVIAYASPAAMRVLDLPEPELVGRNLLDLIDPAGRPTEVRALVRPDDHGIGVPVELRVLAGDGSVRHLEAVVTDLTENRSIGGLVLNARDVTERVNTIAALAAKALTDALTELPGRFRLFDRLDTALAGDPSRSVVVLLVDLDHMREFNREHTREVGDELLRQVARRLAEALPDDGFLARLGGDEFVVVLPDANADAGLVVASRLRSAVVAPVELGGGRATVTASIGVSATQAGAGADPDDALHNAERAVAHAKASGRDRIEVYTDEMASLENHRRTVEQTLRRALDSNGMEVHYQPIVDVASGEVVSAEALLRVHDDGGPLLSPAEFIEAAESSGLIARVGSQVLEATCDQLAAWLSTGGPGLPREVSVNISPRQLADAALAEQVVGALTSAGIPPDRLSLEITESILIGAQSTIDSTISFLRDQGVRIGLDDFGAGQSSLGYLKRFQLDFVKIDRSLVAGLGIHEQDTAIVRATTELAHNLGLVVVAVGVETDEQLEVLRLLGCDRAQGYRFAPPRPASDF